ncbi:putative Serine/threonineprotein kinase [Balamuthia mandrillaris]
MEEDEGMPNTDFANRIHYQELIFGEEIGTGSFGSVYKGSYLGTPVAIKKIAKQEELQEELDIFVEREKAMTRFSHPHLVQFIGVCEYDSFVYLITEYVPGGDLRRYLKDRALEMTWKLRVQVACDVAKAMAFLHSKRIMHRDLKSKNLLVDSTWKIKVCDFGFARTFTPKAKKMYTLCGTEDWMAPEIIMGLDYDESVDSFSYGIVLCEIITREKVSTKLQRSAEEAFSMNFEMLDPLIPPDCPQILKELALRCCAFEASDRPDFIEIIRILDDLEKKLQTEGAITTSGKTKAEPEPVTPKPEIKAPEMTLAKAVQKQLAVKDSKKGKKEHFCCPFSLTTFFVYAQATYPFVSLLVSILLLFFLVERTESSTPTGSATQRRTSSSSSSSQNSGVMSPPPARTKFTVFKRSASKRKASLAKLHDVGQLQTLRFANPEAFYSALAKCFSARSFAGWVLIGYESINTLCLQDCGTTLPELVSRLKEDEVQYVLIRVGIPPNSSKRTATTRDVFIMWTGSEMPAVQKGKKKSHVGEVKTILKPFHAELTAVAKDNFNLQNVISKSDPLSAAFALPTQKSKGAHKLGTKKNRRMSQAEEHATASAKRVEKGFEDKEDYDAEMCEPTAEIEGGRRDCRVFEAYPHVRRLFLRKVYTLLLSQIVITALVVLGYHFIFPSLSTENYQLIATQTEEQTTEPTTGDQQLALTPTEQSLISFLPAVFWLSFLGGFGTLLGLQLVPGLQQAHPTNLVLLYVFTLCEANLLGVALLPFAPELLLKAFLTTVSVFVGLILYTLEWTTAKKGPSPATHRDYHFLGSFLVSCLWVLLFGGFLHVLLPVNSFVDTLWTLFGAIVFCGFVIADTYRLHFLLRPDQHIMAAISLYLDFINLFIRILRLMSKRQR